MGKVIITVGPPGVGKSYWIKQYIEQHDVPYAICSADHYFEKDGKYIYKPTEIGFAHNTCFEKFVNALRAEVPLIFVDNTNIVKEHRAKYVNKALEYDYEVEIKAFPVDIERIKAQNASDERKVAGKVIPDSVIDRMVAKLDIEPGTYKLVDRKPVRILETNLFIRSKPIK